MLSQQALNYQQVAELDETDLDRIEIKFYSKRKRGLFNIETFKKIFDLSDKNNFNKMKVKASSSYEGTGEIIDMLDDLYIVTEKIKVTDKKNLDTQDIIIKLNQIYDYHINKVKELV